MKVVRLVALPPIFLCNWSNDRVVVGPANLYKTEKNLDNLGLYLTYSVVVYTMRSEDTLSDMKIEELETSCSTRLRNLSVHLAHIVVEVYDSSSGFRIDCV